MTFKEALAVLNTVKVRYDKYQNNKLKLTKQQASDLENEYYTAIRTYKAKCPHNEVIVFEGSYTDVGYGLDRHYKHYDIWCPCCSKLLLDRVDNPKDYELQRGLTGTLEEAIDWLQNREPARENELEKLGFVRRTVTTHKTWIEKR